MKKKIAILLILGCLCSGILSCGEKSTNTDTIVTTVSEQTAETEANYLDTLPKKDYGGKTVQFLVASETLWGHEEINAEEITGEPINDAIYARNRTIESKYNVVIQSVQENYASIGNKIMTLVQANDATYDAFLPRINAVTAAAQQGYLLDMKTMPYINTDNPWWDKNIVSDLSVNDKAFFLTGDIHLYANDATHIILFNKDLLADYNLENVYDLVDSNQWTFSKFEEMGKQVVTDVNGDGTYLWGDRFGMQCANYAIPAFLSAAQSSAFVKKSENSFEINITSQRFTTVFESLNRMMNDGNFALNMEDAAKYKIPSGEFSHEWIEAMANKQCLFMLGVLDYMEIFYDVESNFGIVPIPKFDEKQEKYISPVMADAIAVCVPVTTTDPEMIGLVLEALAAESHGELRNAYYDITLQRKRVRDDESADMLDIIFASRSYPLDMVYNWGNLSSDLIGLIKKDNVDLASLYAKKEKSITKAIEKTIEGYTT